MSATVTYCSDANQSDRVGPLDLIKNLFVQLSDFWPVMIGRTARLQQSYLHVSICCLSKLWGQSAPGPSQHHQLQRRSLRNLLIVARSRQERGGQSVRCWRVEGLRATEEEQRSTSSVPGHSAAGRHTGPVRTGETQPTLLIDLIDVSTTS